MPRPIAIDDFMKLRLVSDPQITPDGTRVACVVKRIERDKNKYLSQIWVLPTGTALGAEGTTETEPNVPEARAFSSDDSSAFHPRWSPDGKRLAFLSDRQKPLSQIYLLPSDGGEARALTHLEMEGSIGGFRWSPDGSKIAFTFRATPEPYHKKVVEERKQKELSSPVRKHDRLFYRLDGMGYWDGEYFQVWVADVETGNAKQLTSGAYNCGLPTWSPDSRTLAFVSDRRADGDIAPAQDDIWTVAVADVFAAQPTAETEQANPEYPLTRIISPPGDKDFPAWSPDGKSFAYVGLTDPLDTWHSGNERVFILPVEGSDTARDLTGHTDQSVGWLTNSDSHEVGAGDLLQWSLDSKFLYFTASVRGDTRLCRADIDTVEVATLLDDGEVGDYHAGSKVVYSIGSATLPHELVVYNDDRTVLTHFNEEWLDEIHFAAPEVVNANGPDGTQIHAWLLRPPQLQTGQKFPLVVYVHGGPHLQYGNTFHHELQWLAAQGYVVLYANPRGSKGYGEAHTKAIAGNWGSVDYDDIMAATDWACGQEFVDAERTAIMGGSYGGYMTAWAIGHTNRFRAPLPTDWLPTCTA